MKIFELSKKQNYKEKAVEYFWKPWGNETNFKFYEDCMEHALNGKLNLPKFYIGLEKEEIVGSYALLTNDLISRQDLYPWFACLYVNESKRKKGYAEKLLNHGLAQAKEMGYDELYLCTDLVDFYEKKGWSQYGVGYGLSGDPIKIYSKSTK